MATEESKAKVKINPDFLPFLKDLNSVNEDVNLSLAMYLFTARKLTLARASELCDKSISDFIQVLIDHDIHWAEYTEEHKKQDDETIDFIMKKLGEDDEGSL